LLDKILQARLRINVGNGGTRERTIGELVAAARIGDGPITSEAANDELKRNGIRYESPSKKYNPKTQTWADQAEGVWISSTHSAIQRLLSDTQWSVKWHLALLRLPGATMEDKVIRFASGAVSRAVWLPIDTVLPDDGE
jgi:hypothetical protein